MKTFVIMFFLTLLLNNCADKNAFDNFNLSPTKELSEDSIQSLKIKRGNEIAGIVNVIYLNKVLPKLYKKNEYFYVYYYIKDKNATVNFTLNGEASLLREELPAQNRFSSLTSFSAPWSKYYLVGFKKQGNVLKLRINSSSKASAAVEFIKDK